MKFTIYRCDAPNCGKEFREDGGLHIRFATGSERDPVDGSVTTIYKDADICCPCSGRFVAALLVLVNEEQRLKLAKQWGAK